MTKFKCEKCNSESEDAAECCGQARAEVTEEAASTESEEKKEESEEKKEESEEKSE